MAPSGQPSFIVIEGLDAAGTTTQAALLADALRARDLRVRLTAEPTDGPMGRLARSHVTGETALDPHTAALVFSADRADHLDRVIRPALGRGEWVVCDRYLLSTLAYQGADGVDRDVILAASSAFDVPDLTVVLDVPVEVRADRIGGRGRLDRYEHTSDAARYASAYETSIAVLRAEGHRIELVDGTPPPDRVLEAVLARLDASL